MVQIATVATRGGGKYTNNADLGNYAGFALTIKSFEADYQNERSKYKSRGPDGRMLPYQLEDRVFGDFVLYDAGGNNVGELQDTTWSASKSCIRGLQPLVGQTVVINVAKREGSDGNQYWNVNNIGGPLLEAIVKDLTARQEELEKAIEEGPDFL